MARRTLLCLVLVAGACTKGAPPAAPRLASETQPLDTSNLPGTVGNPFPGMGKTLSESIPIWALPESLSCPYCSFSNGFDPDTSATHAFSAGSGSIASSYTPPLLTGTNVATTWNEAASAAQQSINNPPAGVDNFQSALQDFHDAFSALALLGGNLTPPLGDSVSVQKTQWVRNFKPVFGRNLSTTDFPIVFHGATGFPDPPLLAEITNRGARSYCAMRNAAVDAPSTGSLDMIDNQLLSLLFWQIGYTHADVTLMPISDMTNRWPPAPGPAPKPEGSQSFYIPVALGVQVAPLKGPIIPDFGEFSHQLAWVTGDAAVLDAEDPIDVGVGPHAEKFYGSEYRDLEHYDVWSGTSYSGTTGFDSLTLVDFGLFQILMGGNVTVVSGALEDPAVAAADSLISQNSQNNAWLPVPGGEPQGGVLYDYFGLAQGLGFHDEGCPPEPPVWPPPPPLPCQSWPTPRVNSFWLSGANGGNTSLQSGGAFDDAIGLTDQCAGIEVEQPFPFYQYALNDGCSLFPYPDTHTSSGPPSYAVDLTHHAGTTPGAVARWRNDDDRTFVLRDSVDMGVSITGAGGIDLDILQILLEATASIDVDTYVDTIVSESLSLIQSNGANAETVSPPPVAHSATEFLQTNLRVTPVGNTAIDFKPLSIKLHFEIDLYFFHISFDIPLSPVPDININTNPVVPPESSRLRVGEYSDLTSTEPGYSLDSHFPKAGAFASLPETTDQCLADNVSGGHLPMPTPGTPGSDPQKGGICLAGPLTFGLESYRAITINHGPPYTLLYTPAEPSPIEDLPLDICTNPVDAVTWAFHFENPLQQSCVQFTINYLCGLLNNTEQDAQIIEYNPESPSNPKPTIAHLLTKAPNEGQLAQDMWSQCTQAFSMPNGSQGTDPATVQALSAYFTHNFVDLYQCDPTTLLPVGGGSDLTPGSNCPRPDPNTQQCWTFPPCYPDPTTGWCDSTCVVASTGGECTPVPPPTFCVPNGTTGSATGVPCPTCTINPVTGSCETTDAGQGCTIDPLTGACETPDAGCTIDPVTGACETPDAGGCVNEAGVVICPDAGVPDAGGCLVNEAGVLICPDAGTLCAVDTVNGICPPPVDAGCTINPNTGACN